MREIVHIQAGQCGNQIGAKVRTRFSFHSQKLNVFVNIILKYLIFIFFVSLTGKGGSMGFIP